MPLDSRDMFEFMRESYRVGLMQKWLAITAEATRAELDEAGQSGYDLLDAMDRSNPVWLEATLERLGPWLKWESKPLVMKTLSRLLDVPPVRKRLLVETRKRTRNALEPS